MSDDIIKTLPPEFKVSDGFAGWLAAANGSLVFTARRLGKVFTVGLNDADEVVFFERSFPDPAALLVEGTTLFMSDRFRVWRFENAITQGVAHPYAGFDSVYVPEMMYRTGAHDAHDLGLLKNGMIAFASTRMNCVGGCSAYEGMVPLWQPRFISELIYEDRCHLNGLAVEGGAVKYVTTLSQTDTAEGWRDVRADGGVLMDVTTGGVVLDGLSMPHSPRIRDGKVWFVNSGTGEVGFVDGKKKPSFKAKINVPGFARGLVFVDDCVITTTSKLRESESFQELPLEKSLKKSKTKDSCGLYVCDYKGGKIQHSITVENDTISEIYDVAFVPNAKRIMLGGLHDELSEQIITVGSAGH